SDVGLVPHNATESWNSTIPNKLFDYMAAGLAILTSDARPAARVVNQTRCGLVYPHRDADALAEAIVSLCDPELRRQHGQNGRRAIAETYNWETDASRLELALQAAVTKAQ